MKIFTRLVPLLAVSACAMSGSVQRLNVDYNYSIESITNQLALLNVLRAMDGLPLHYTSVQRLTGNISITGTAGFNAQIKGSAPLATSSDTDARAPTGTTLTDVVSRAVTTGGNIYAPSVGASVTTGPSFDVNILDSQAFYQGVLSSVPFPTIYDFITQNYDNEEIMALLIEEINFAPAPDNPIKSQLDPSIPTRVVNSIPFITTSKKPSQSDSEVSLPSNPEFDRIITCFNLESAIPPNIKLAPFSRLQAGKLTLSDLAQLDGTKLDLSAPLSANPDNDRNIWIERPSVNKQMPQFVETPRPCKGNIKVLSLLSGPAYVFPSTPPPNPIYLGNGEELDLSPTENSGEPYKTNMTIIFRSPEGVIRYLGDCLSEFETTHKDRPDILCQIGDGKVIFAIRKGTSPNPLVAVSLLGQDYYVDSTYYKPTMETIGLIERLVDLQKIGTQAPATAAVQIVP